ncbi:adaptin ear-binding coat-associated protein 1 NECAP-1 [Gorgonomyces haynaldii]|nr:adaptin ear-binding coat-associated protein 1 NECAP-1 [Gorgonomyces haynaldii]
MYESVLCVIRECMVYQIPPRTTARQYRAGDWDVEKPIWTGRLRVIAVGDDVALHLEDGNSGELFAKCPVDPNLTSVEPVSDSSRYFVIKIQDQASGKHAFVGLGFPERSWAFDMNVALQDHFKQSI